MRFMPVLLADPKSPLPLRRSRPAWATRSTVGDDRRLYLLASSFATDPVPIT